MALTDFIPTGLMNELINSKIRKNLVAADVVATDYMGLLSGPGSSVKIPTVDTSAGASTYTRDSSLTYSVLGSSNLTLTINQEKYFAYSVDAIDSKQAAINIVNESAIQASRDLAEAADTYLLQTIFEGATTTGGSNSRALGVSGTPITVYAGVYGAGTSAATLDAIGYLGRLSQRLDEADAPVEGRWAICPPWFVNYLIQAKVIAAATDGEMAFTNGKIGRAYGFDIRVSTNLRNYNTTNSYIFAGTKYACQFASQLNRLDIFDMQAKFATGIRGLYTYGSTLVKPTHVAFGVISQG